MATTEGTHFAQIAEERRALAHVLRSLTPEQEATQSLCGAWTMHDVIAHLVVPLVTRTPDLVRALVAGRFNFNGMNQALVRQQSGRTLDDLLDELDRRATSKFTPPGHDSQAPLTDVKVHGLDITVPLGLDLGRPADTWIPVLAFLTSPRAERGFVRRDRPALRLVASDTDFAWGDGPEVTGPATALTAALTGRGALDHQLSGEGLPALLSWQRRS
jgi:uncharacterized protein (TIGR03083 family)